MHGGSSPEYCLCYQRLRVSCALCNNLQAARPRQTTERRLAPLYVEHMPSIYITSNKNFILKYFRCRDGKRTETRIGIEGICTRSMQGMCGASAAKEHCA